MVGQVFNRAMIEEFVDKGAYPRFTIIVGTRGSGRKTLSYFIADKLDAMLSTVALGVDDVRETIKSAYFCSSPIVYLFPDAGNMSPQAKNALLKVTEEAPKKAYFILTVTSLSDVPETLVSRASVLRMESYSTDELKEFLGKSDEFILGIATNPGEIQKLTRGDFYEFFSFVEAVLDNIGSVTGVNAFKIVNRFNYTDEPDDTKYDPELFLRVLMTICYHRLINMNFTKTGNMEVIDDYRKTLDVCSKYRHDLTLTGLRKDATMDMWILAMREIWVKD